MDSLQKALLPGNPLQRTLNRRTCVCGSAMQVPVQLCVLFIAICTVVTVDLERAQRSDELGQVLGTLALDRARYLGQAG